MEDHNAPDFRPTQPDLNAFQEPNAPERKPWALFALVFALACGIGITLLYLARAKDQNRELASANSVLSGSVTQMQTQLQLLGRQVDDLRAAQATAAAPPPRPVRRTASVAESRPAPQRQRDDPRFKELQDRLSAQQTALSDQQKQIAGAREDIGKTRDDLQGALNSAHDELSGSIAKTHDEVVALQKRGERNYYEFSLDKGKQFQRVGPLSLSLRKANIKRKSYDMAMLVDDNQLQKKSVNLYETVWISIGDRPQPLELVVNQIGKDHIQGYLSEPKYKKSELDTSAAVDRLQQ